jgi:tetratricopeptide (TPR) repeat protein
MHLPLPITRFTSALLFLATCWGCAGDSLSPTELLERGKYLSDKERSAEAITLFDRALESTPTNPELFYLRGLAKERTGDLDGAIEDYGRAIALRNSYREAFNNRAVLLARQGQFEKAVADFSKVLAISPNFSLGYKNRGLALHDLERLDAALEDYNRALELEPDSQGYFLRGNVRLEQKQYQQAVEDYDQALKLDELNARAWLNRGVALSHLGDTLGARENLHRAASVDNTIITRDVLKALQKISSSSSLQIKLPMEKVGAVLKPKGWTVEPAEDRLFPYWITKEGSKRKLCIAIIEADEGKLSVPAATARAMVAEKAPKSLLLYSYGANQEQETTQLIEQWNPTEGDLEVATIDILLAVEAPPVP